MTPTAQHRSPAPSERPTDSSAPATHENSVCIIGCGKVGMAAAFTLIQSPFIRELVLVDRGDEKVEGEVMDLEHAVAVPMRSPVSITHRSYADAARCSIVVVTAGVATSDDKKSRLDLVGENAVIIRKIVGQLKDNGFAGILIVASNPVDILAQVAFEASGLASNQVIGTGTLIDTARLRGLMAEACGVEPRAVDAFIIGEHGDSEIAVWSGAKIGGVQFERFADANELPGRDEMLERIRQAAPEVVKRKGHTAYAIGLAIQRICEAVLRNEQAVLAVSTLLQGEYGLSEVYLGTPCVIGKNGVERVIALDLDADEQAGLDASAETLKATYASVNDV